MIRVVITGAAGRMGRMLVAAAAADPEFKLVGATEYAGSEFIGQDAGRLAGVAELGVKLENSLSKSML